MSYIDAKAKLEEEGEREAENDLAEISRAVDAKLGSEKKGASSRQLQKDSKKKKKEQGSLSRKAPSAARSRSPAAAFSTLSAKERFQKTTDLKDKAETAALLNEENEDQRLELHRYYHSVEIATARVDAVLAKLDAPMRSHHGRSAFEEEISGWQKELCLDDHTEYAPVTFNEKRDNVVRGELNRELVRLQVSVRVDHLCCFRSLLLRWFIATRGKRTRGNSAQLASLLLLSGFILFCHSNRRQCLFPPPLSLSLSHLLLVFPLSPFSPCLPSSPSSLS